MSGANAALAAINGFFRFWIRKAVVSSLSKFRNKYQAGRKGIDREDYVPLVKADKEKTASALRADAETICATGIRVSEQNISQVGSPFKR